MKINRKKLLSAVLSAALAISLLPSAVLAEELNEADFANQPVMTISGDPQGDTGGQDSGEPQGDNGAQEDSKPQGDTAAQEDSGAQSGGPLKSSLQVTSAFAGGSGTQSDPYQIGTAGQLAMVAENLGASYVLVEDITLTGTWTPIGAFQASTENAEAPNEAAAFHGTFDGNGKTIIGLSAGGENAACVGLFGVTSNAAVMDLTLADAQAEGFTMTAAAIGYAYNTTVDNVDLTGTNAIHGRTYAGHSDTGSNAANMVAGIVGAGMDSTILNCDVSGTALTMDGIPGAAFSGGNVHDAGLVGGGLEGCTLENCTATGGRVEVTADGGFAFGIGGLAGCAIEAKYVKNCAATNVTVSIADGAADLIGGLLGYSGTSGLAAPTQFDGCNVSGATITAGGESTRVGGLLGGGFYFPEYAAYYPVPARIRVSNCTAAPGSYELVGWVTDLDSVEGAVADQFIFTGGNGSANTPYEISSAAALYAVGYGLNASYKLTADIDLGAAFDLTSGDTVSHRWQPIGVLRYGTDVDMSTGAMDMTKTFSGAFDGGNHTISNVTVDAGDDETMLAPGGIFSCVTGTVKDLTVKNVTVISNENMAMATGGVIGYSMTGAVLSNVNLTADDQRNTVSGRNCVGGITGGGESAALSGCNVSKTDIVVLGSNDFSATPGRMIQCDVAECGGPVVGGGFGGSIAGCSAADCTVSAAGNEPVGLGGLAGCLQCMTAITDNTVSGVTITTQRGGHAIGGLCGYAGTGNDGAGIDSAPAAPTAVTGNTVDIIINAPGATHVGGLIGSGLYFFGMEDRYAASGNTVTGSITAGTGPDSLYGATTPGAIAGRAVGCTIEKSNTFSGLTINNAPAVDAVGTTNVMYESGDQYGEEDTASFIHGISNTYQQLFEGATFLPKCDAYWHDFSAAVVGADQADEMVAMMKRSIGAAEGEQGEGNFFCGFKGGLATLTFNGLQISGYDAQGVQLFSHPYRYVGAGALYSEGQAVMPGFTVLQSLDANSGEYAYFLMAPDTPDKTYHIEFRYGSDLDALEQFVTGSYASWLAAGIPTSAMAETTGNKGRIDNALRQVIALFCTENLSESETAQTAAQRSALVGIWDANAETLAMLEAETGLKNIRMYCELKADGTGATYLDMGSGSYSKTADYTFYAYDNDGSDSTASGVYIAAIEGGATSTSPYTIVTGRLGKTLSLYAEDGTASYVKRGSDSGGNSGSGGGSGSGSGGGGASAPGNAKINVIGGSVTAAQMTEAVKNAAKGAAISINAAGAEQVTLPVSGLTSAQANRNSLIITAKNGVIAVSVDALAGIIRGASSDANVRVGITAASAFAADLPDGTPAFDVVLAVGGQAVHSFDGALTITLTVANLEKIENPHVLHILSDGTRQYRKPTVSGNRLTVGGVRNLSVFAVIPGSEVPADPAFTDVASGAYYEDAVRWAVAKGVTSGINATAFAPNAACTRAQAVTVLWRAAGSPEPASMANPFADVDSGAYYFKAVLWALEKGITGGTSATAFSPNKAVTRAQIVTFQYRAAGSPAVTSANSFADVPFGAYYTNAIVWAVEKAITNGTTATTFHPNTNCTRGQIVTFLYRQFAM